jgi:integrase
MMLAPATTIVLTVSPSLNGDSRKAYSTRGQLFDCKVDGRCIVERSTTPLCDAARVVLSPEEVARFLEAALSVAHGAGLRVSEVVALKVSDIDSERMMLRVEQGKGRKDRHAMLSPVLLELLRDWPARRQTWPGY